MLINILRAHSDFRSYTFCGKHIHLYVVMDTSTYILIYIAIYYSIIITNIATIYEGKYWTQRFKNGCFWVPINAVGMLQLSYTFLYHKKFICKLTALLIGKYIRDLLKSLIL